MVAARLDWEQSEWDLGLQGLALGWGLHGGNGYLQGGSEVPLPGLAGAWHCVELPQAGLGVGQALVGTPSSMQGAMGWALLGQAKLGDTSLGHMSLSLWKPRARLPGLGRRHRHNL